MPFKTQYGSHYHMTEGCHGATIPCDTTGLTPCSDCCGTAGQGSGGGSAGGAGTGAGTGSGFAGGGGDIPFLTEEENAEIASQPGTVVAEAGAQGEPLDAYDSQTSATHAEGLVEDGAKAVAGGLEAPDPKYGIVPEAFAGMTDTLSSFGIESLPCPDHIPESWGRSEPAPESLPNWDAPLRAPGEYWFYEMAAYSPNRLLAMQVAAAVAPAMDRWPGATGEMLKYGLNHGFMTAPASTCYHLNTPGGLACHSASVTACAIEMLEQPENEHIRKELGPDWREVVSVVALWHDACKMDFYEPLDHPRTRSDGKVAYYGVAKSRQNDSRHGELSSDIVRRFYGKALPEVAYQAIDLHMGTFDHRYSPPKWVKDALDDDLQAKKAAEEADRREKQDIEVSEGRIWWQLRRKMDDRRELARAIRGKGEHDAAEAIGKSSDPHAKRARVLMSRMERMQGTGDPLEQEYEQELRQIVKDCSVPEGTDDITVARGILTDERGHADGTLVTRRRKAQRLQDEAEAFQRQMERIWEEHPFVRLIHEADAKSASLGR